MIVGDMLIKFVMMLFRNLECFSGKDAVAKSATSILDMTLIWWRPMISDFINTQLLAAIAKEEYVTNVIRHKKL